MLTDSWRELRSLLYPVTQAANVQEHRIELLGGGVVEMWSLDAGDTVRGRAYGCVVVDEAALAPNLERSWQEAIRPTLTDLSGEAWFLSTPRGMNYFRALYDLGQDPERPDWASWQMPTAANPFISPAEIEAARQDMTEAAFGQEYLAEFISWEGAVFRYVREAATADPMAGPETGHEYAMGIDWGRSIDFTAMCVLDVTARAMVALDRSNRIDYTVQRDRLRALYERWRPAAIIAESNSIGQPVIEALWRDGLPVQPFTTTNASKAAAIEALALAFERSEIRILPDPVLIGELQAFRAEPLPSGLMRYSAPAGQHDDTVMALALAWQAVSGRQTESTLVYFDGQTGELTEDPDAGRVSISPY
jgi:hypothetical protein